MTTMAQLVFLAHFAESRRLAFLFFYLRRAEISTFLHAYKGEAVTRLTNEKVPYFNAPIYLQNKTQIGKVQEIFGPINEAVS